MTRTVFEEVRFIAIAKFRCSACNKKLRRQKKFCQTLNPFNRTKAGDVKTREQIMAELEQKADSWANNRIKCAVCSANVMRSNIRAEKSQL